MSDQREIALLTNPTAGKGRGLRVRDALLPRFHAAGLTVRSLVGGDADEALDLALAAVAGGAEALVVVGGDGMVNIGLQAVATGPVALGIVPTGTGNDVARYLGLSRKDPLAAADRIVAALATGRRRTLDLGRVWQSMAAPTPPRPHLGGVADARKTPSLPTRRRLASPRPERPGHPPAITSHDRARVGGRFYATVMAAGFDAVVNERANQMTWPRGQMRYNLATLAELRTFTPLAYTLDLDGEPRHLEAMLVAVGNGPSFGGGLRIAEGAELDDGLLDVVVIKPISKTELVRTYPRLFRGTHTTHPQYERHRVTRVTVAAPGIVAYADGERFGPLPLTIESVPGAVEVLT